MTLKQQKIDFAKNSLEGIFEESELKLVDNYNLWMVVCNSSQLKWVLNCKLNNKFTYSHNYYS